MHLRMELGLMLGSAESLLSCNQLVVSHQTVFKVRRGKTIYLVLYTSPSVVAHERIVVRW